MQGSSEAFLLRAMKASKLKGLPGELLVDGAHLCNLKEKIKSEFKLNANRTNTDEGKLEDEAKIEVEEHRAVANVIGLAGVISVNFAKGSVTFAMTTTDLTRLYSLRTGCRLLPK